MEFSPEIAVIQSSLQLANKQKYGESKKPCSEFIKLVGSAVHDIIDGFETERSDLERQFWRFKLFSLLLHKVLHSERQTELLTSTNSGNLQNLASSVNLICQQLPPLHLKAFLEIVKHLNWFDLLSQGLCVLDQISSRELVSHVIDHATEDPVDGNDLHLISAVLDCVISQWISKSVDESSTCEETSKLASWLKNIFYFLTNVLGKEVNKGDHAITFLLHTFRQLALCGTLCDKTEDTRVKFNNLLKSAHQTRETIKKQDGLFSRFCTLCTMQSSTFSEITVMSSSVEFPFCEWMETFNTLSVILKENYAEFDQCLKFNDHILIVTNQVFTFSLESVVSCFSELIESEKYIALLKQANIPDVAQSCSIVSEISRCLLASLIKVKEEREREEKEFYSTFPLEDILKHRLPGCEEMLQNILSDFDLTWWSKDSVCKDLMNNIDLFCDVDHIKQLKKIIQKGLELHPENTAALNNVKEVLLTAFSSLPGILQEQLIVENYLHEPDPTFLSSVGTFHKDITVIFNKFTSNSEDEELLLAVVRLALQDPRQVVEKSVETAVRNSGQIHMVVKILRTLSDLCQSFHPEFHPDRSLLSHIVRSHLLTCSLQDKEKTNIVTFILLAIKSFQKHICGRDLQEPPVLDAEDFLSICVLPYIGVETMFESDQPVTIEFSLRLLTAVIEEVGCDRTSSMAAILNPCPLLLCLCALLQQCVVLTDDPNPFVAKVTIKQLCVQCWSSWEKVLKTNVSSLTDTEVDWLISETKYFDWTVLLRLQTTLHVLQGKNEEDLFLDNVASCLISDCNYISLFRFVSISDKNMQTVAVSDPVIVEEIILSLLQVLPNVTITEAKRVCVYVKCLLNASCTHFPFRLIFQDITDLADFQGMKGVLHLSQVLLDVFVVAVHSPQVFPPVVLRHMITCYVAVVKCLTEDDFTNEDPHIVRFAFSQVFCHISIITSLVTSDLSEALFVLLLEVISKYAEHETRTDPKTLMSSTQSTWGPLLQAVHTIEHEDIKNTLMMKLKECNQSAGH